ncbi:hypothetical protein TcWFU_001580 [Taenia crassiceps]|uniref:Uncharacterized protein n=1 Tax=Taenia crassiceps TaxID=6207 RepID=A0ABR4QAK9_9CEST
MSASSQFPPHKGLKPTVQWKNRKSTTLVEVSVRMPHPPASHRHGSANGSDESVSISGARSPHSLTQPILIPTPMHQIRRAPFHTPSSVPLEGGMIPLTDMVQ